MILQIDQDDFDEIVNRGNNHSYNNYSGQITVSKNILGSVIFREERIANDLLIVDARYYFNNSLIYKGWGSAPLLEMQFNLSRKSIGYATAFLKSDMAEMMSCNIVYDAENTDSRITFDSAIPYNTFGIHFSPAFLLKYQGGNQLLDLFLERIRQRKSAALFDDPIHINIKMMNVIRDMRACIYRDAMRRLYLESKMLELLAYMFENKEKDGLSQNLSPYDLDKIKQAAFLIEQNLSSPLTVAELATETGINPNKLNMGFKSLFGTTVFAYLQNYRMQQARRWLQDGNLSVLEISAMCGYSDMSNFSAAFKKKFGFPPSRLRIL